MSPLRRALPCLLLVGCASAATSEDRESIEPAPRSAPEVVIPSQPAAEPEPDPAPTTDASGDSEACGIDLEEAARQWEESFGDEVRTDELDSHPLADVDGDGEPETLLYAELHCGVTGNCSQLLYLSGSGCPKFSLALWANFESITVEPRPHGLADLVTYLKEGCAGMAGTYERYRYRDGRWGVVETIECECPNAHPDEPEDPRCRG